MIFRVWAPQAKTVELVLADVRRQMIAGEGGWWQADVPDAGAGTEYGFAIDGGKTLPDPRSAWQPCGSGAQSRVLDHDAFEWHDRGFQAAPLEAGVLYELHVGTFSPEGTFDGAAARLGHLLDLGITHVELMPVVQFPGVRGWGYEGTDLFAPHHAYGGPDGFKRFVAACHAHGLGVVLDVVYNHFGPEDCYLNAFGPYCSDHHRTPWGDAVNFDGRGSDEVRRFIVDNALMWLRDYHADGLRLDAVHALPDSSAVHILEEISQSVADLSARTGRHYFVIGESDLNDPRVVQRTEAGGLGLGAQWSDDFHHALHVALTGERTGYFSDFSGLPDLARALEHVFVYAGQRSAFRDRRHGRPPLGVPPRRFLGYLQNHDQIGNRARGERIGHLVSAGRQKIGAAVVLTSPFVPMLFQGEEWAASSPFQYFTNLRDPALQRAVVEGRRREFEAFGWRSEQIPDPTAVETFERCKLQWDELSQPPHAGMLQWYRDLVRLRRSHPDLAAARQPDTCAQFDQEKQWMIVHRGVISVAFNFAAAQPLPLQAPAPKVLLSSGPEARLEESTLHLPPESVCILEHNRGMRMDGEKKTGGDHSGRHPR